MNSSELRQMTRRFACAGLALLLLAWPALAAESETHAGPHSPIGMVFRWINFAVLAAGLLYLLRKAPAAFRRRAERIGASITESGAVKAEADRRLREAEEMLGRLNQEISEFRAAAMRDAATEHERIRAMAHEEAAKIRRAAEGEIGAAERAARIELKALAARLAVERAEADIRSQITPQAEEGLFRSFLGNLLESVN